MNSVRREEAVVPHPPRTGLSAGHQALPSGQVGASRAVGGAKAGAWAGPMVPPCGPGLALLSLASP